MASEALGFARLLTKDQFAKAVREANARTRRRPHRPPFGVERGPLFVREFVKVVGEAFDHESAEAFDEVGVALRREISTCICSLGKPKPGNGNDRVRNITWRDPSAWRVKPALLSRHRDAPLVVLGMCRSVLLEQEQTADRAL